MRLLLSALAIFVLMAPMAMSGPVGSIPPAISGLCWTRLGNTAASSACLVLPCSDGFESSSDLGDPYIRTPSTTFRGIGYYDLVRQEGQKWFYSGWYLQTNEACLDGP